MLNDNIFYCGGNCALVYHKHSVHNKEIMKCVSGNIVFPEFKDTKRPSIKNPLWLTCIYKYVGLPYILSDQILCYILLLT